MLRRLLKYSSLILLTIIIIVGGLISYQFQSAKAQGLEFDFAGWIWSENYGWISLNSDNCSLLTPGNCFVTDPPIDYSVKIDADNNITGYAWSENVGWVCFGDGGLDPKVGCTTGQTPPGGWTTKMNPTTGKISGWARINSLGNDGWIKLRSGKPEPVPGGTGEACYDCKPKCEQWTTIDDDEGNPIPGEPCIEYSQTEFDSCNTCFSQTSYDGTDYPTSQDPNLNESNFVVGGSGYIYTKCGSPAKTCVKDGTRIICENACTAAVPNSSRELYGVNRNLTDGRLLGWSWNGTANGKIGAGWVHFNTEFGSSYIVFPWLQTLYGSIYTPKWVKQKSGVEGRNATYCILAENINVNIKAQNCEDIAAGVVQGVDTGSLQESNSNGVYRNALGKIDITGMINKVPSAGTRNKYGQVVNNLSRAFWTGPIGNVLKGEIYHFDDDLQIRSPVTFINSSANVLGNGIIIVDGNLTIKADITYGAGLPAKLNQLASVVWIVKGDVIIEQNVTSVVGTFIILGNGTTACQLANNDPDYHKYIQNGCGVFFSGNSDKSLTVLGLVISKAYDFGRTFAELLQGSERIIYDGRLTANPPKALSGFVEGLPVIRDFSY